MPVVDMSMVGLQGQQAFATRMQTLAQAENLQTTSRVNQFALEQEQRMVDIERRAAESLSSIAATGRAPGSNAAVQDTGSAADVHEHLGGFFLREGAVERGTKMIQEAHKIRKEEQELENAQWTVEEQRLNNIIKGAGIVSQHIGIARNEGEWRLGLSKIRNAVEQGLFIMEPEHLEQLEAMEFTPEAAAYFNEAALQAKDRADLEIRERIEAREAAHSATRLAQGAASIGIAEARLAETIRMRQLAEKHQGSTVTSAEVSATDRDAMAARLVAGPLAYVQDPIQGTPLTKDHSITRDLAVRLEEDAKLILRRRPGITIDQAREIAIQTAITNGEIEPGTPDPGWFRSAEPGAVRRSPKRDKGVVPKPLPISHGSINVEQLIKGELYNLPDGLATWDGESFVVE